MASIYRYQKIIDEITTHCLLEPDYNLLDAEERIVELCELDGYTYISVPDGIKLPIQPENISVESVKLTVDLADAIKKISPHIALINERVVNMIREKYSVNDEIKMLRIGPSDETATYNMYTEECRAWGRSEKLKLGF
jgi:cellulose biosynthesis protein BcsQ